MFSLVPLDDSQGRTVVDLCVAISQIGFCVSYLLFIGNSMHEVSQAWVSGVRFVLACVHTTLPTYQFVRNWRTDTPSTTS